MRPFAVLLLSLAALAAWFGIRRRRLPRGSLAT